MRSPGFTLLLAIVQCFAATSQWRAVMIWWQLEREYSPEQLAERHIHIPHLALPLAIAATLLTLFTFWLAYRRAEE